jgi:hypothetical protein
LKYGARMSSRSGTLADLAIIVMALPVIGRLALDAFDSKSTRAELDQRRPAPEAAWKGGEILPKLHGVEFDRAERTVILFLKSTCRFCTESMPCYEQLVRLRKAGHSPFQLVAVSTEAKAALEAYLSSHGIEVDRALTIERAQLRELKLAGTPTLILVDRTGTVIEQWRGMIPEPQVRNVLALIAGTSSALSREGS